MLDNLVTVDPGFEGTGWAYWRKLWQGDEWNHTMRGAVGPTPQRTGVIRLGKVDKERHWLTRAIIISSNFGGVLQELVNEKGSKATVLIEIPEFYAASAVSHAASVKGDLTILTALSGMLLRVAWDCGWSAMCVTPTEWKGQMNKKVLQARIGRILHTVYRDHEADAVGMGMHMAGLL